MIIIAMMHLIASGIWLPAAAGPATGPCCDDIESRITEIETSLARKGNRRTSLRIYGQVNRAIMAWDDGNETNVYEVDNETSTTRLGFIGSAQITSDWSAGYRLEIEAIGAGSNFVSADFDDGLPGNNDVKLRHSYWYLTNRQFGRLSIGQQSQATDNITIINLGAQMNDGALHYNNRFDVKVTGNGPAMKLTWGALAFTVDSFRGNFVRYDSPVQDGFLISAAWGEDDFADIALRYAKNWSQFRFAAGFGYMNNRERDFSDLRGSASLIHDPSGIYLSVAGGLRDDQGSVVVSNTDLGHFQYYQLGVKTSLTSLGSTTFYGDLGRYDNFNVGKEIRLMQTVATRHGLTDSTLERWGIGLEQNLDAAGVLLYAQYHHYDARFSAVGCTTEVFSAPCIPAGDPGDFTAEPWQAAVVGARVQF